MYPDMNVDGVGSSRGSGRSDKSSQREEQNPRDINIFGGSRVEDDDENTSMQFIRNRKRVAEEASQKTQSWIDKVKEYMNQGYSQSKAIQMADEDTGSGNVSREALVQKLVDQGYDREFAERKVPRNWNDMRDYARQKGEIEGEARVRELDQKLENNRRRR